MKSAVAKFLLASTFTFCASAIAVADPLVGTWKRSNGILIKYSVAGGGKYCGTVLNGEFKGRSIGCVSGSNGAYKGKVNKLDEGKTYTGKASVTGKTLKLSGCVFGGLLCKSDKLRKQ